MADPIDKLIRAFGRLPGVGQKTAMRYAYYVLRASGGYAQELATALLESQRVMRQCSQCLVPSASDPCTLCSDPRRDGTRICVVEEPADLNAIHKSGAFDGTYHVLHGLLSPLDGIGPDDLQIGPLLQRIERGGIAEVLLAVNPTLEGEATATYLAERLRPYAVQITRLASGIPFGAEVEYVDAQTLAVAVTDRRPIG